MIRAQAFPRAAIIGNPSDGYGGKTIAFTFSDFRAEVCLKPSSKLQFLEAPLDTNSFNSYQDLSSHIKHNGFYGGIRLMKACLFAFSQKFKFKSEELNSAKFELSYSSNIPLRVGLAGSSALIIACLKALLLYFKIELTPYKLAILAWEVENNILRIPCGMQDRVVQSYNHPVYMDFSGPAISQSDFGVEKVSMAQFSNIYIAYLESAGEGSEEVHSKDENREKRILSAVPKWIKYSDEFKEALNQIDQVRINELINKNFDLRKQIYQINPKHLLLINTARSLGLSSKFTGSGGAIVGFYPANSDLMNLEKSFNQIGARFFSPEIFF